MEHFSSEERLRKLWLLESSGEFYPWVLIPKGRVWCRHSQALFSGTQWKAQRPWANSETGEIPDGYQEFYTLSHSESDQTLSEIAWRAYEASTLGKIQKPSEHGPEQ